MQNQYISSAPNGRMRSADSFGGINLANGTPLGEWAVGRAAGKAACRFGGKELLLPGAGGTSGCEAEGGGLAPEPVSADRRGIDRWPCGGSALRQGDAWRYRLVDG